jgi:hypothetical protein
MVFDSHIKEGPFLYFFNISSSRLRDNGKATFTVVNCEWVTPTFTKMLQLRP